MGRRRGSVGRGDAPNRLILDSGAVLAFARADRWVRAFITEAQDRDGELVIPAVVVAETSRGGPRNAPVDRVLKGVDNITPATEATARMAGRLLAAASSAATIDALVVAEAVLGGGAQVVTGDPDDLRILAQQHPEVRIQPL